MNILLLIEALISGAASILSTQTNKTAATVGADLAAANQVVANILKENAALNGVTIDWSDPVAVGNYVTTLPVYVPIPDPAAPAVPPSTTAS